MPAEDPEKKVHCVKLGEELPAMATPPFPTEFGKELQEKVSKQAWDLWLKESVKYINTYRVDLSSREGTEFMLKQLRIWLGMDDGELAKTAWTPEEQAAIDAERNEEG
ncbi:MAG: oxidative damage protection protein [Sandaracinus sp.]|nr:oxidative damage protection protein [Sandaracinus sp.]|tara:strand:- start:1151 stop:1474 length:324 start_codon:yes stop_codon:yes gene_type:complete